MIDVENLRTASLYINNQLLSRGLLRDGQSIDFANAGKESEDATPTSSRVISVVNDLILRRDKDAEHRESLSATMRALRAENIKFTTDITRLTEKNTEAQRKLDIAESSEAAMRTQLKSAEAAARGLKEELTRTKALVAQARSTCANDVRRRDRQIDTLKKQLGEAGRARGSRGNPTITTIHVTADIGDSKASSTRVGGMNCSNNTDSEDYTLRSETNAFLARLSRDLSEENEALVKVMQTTMAHLREMSGWNGDEAQDPAVVKQPGHEELSTELEYVVGHMREILNNPSFVPLEEVMVREEEINRLKRGWVKMEARWEEAVRLIDGWRKRMAGSGNPLSEAELKEGLRLSPVRMSDFGDTEGDLHAGLPPLEEAEYESESHANEPNRLDRPTRYEDNEEEGDDASAHASEQAPDNDVDEVIAVEEVSAADNRQDSSPLPSPPEISPLRNSASAGNRGAVRNGKIRQKPSESQTGAGEKSHGLRSGETSTAPLQPQRTRYSFITRPKRLASKAELPEERARSPSRTSLDEVLLSPGKPEGTGAEREDYSNPPVSAAVLEAGDYDSEESEASIDELQQDQPQPTSRLPLPRSALPAPQQSPLTMSNIAVKLAASEREADAARVRAKLRAARSTSGLRRPAISSTVGTLSKNDDNDDNDGNQDQAPNEDRGDPAKRGNGALQQSRPEGEQQDQQQLKPEKRKRDRKVSKAASRRRSTLSPWELETLMSGNAQ